MAIFDDIVNKLKWTAPVPTALAWLATRPVGGGGGNKRGVITAQPPIVGGGGSGQLETDRSPFGMLPQVSGALGRDPMQDYLNQLLRGINAGQPSPLSIQELRNRATRQASLQFDPEIRALISERGATKKRAGKNKQELRSMFGSLAAEYLDDAKTSKAETKQAKKEEAAALKQLQKDLAGQYSAQLDSQAEEMRNLGIDAAFDESTQGQREDLEFLRNLSATESAAQQRAIDLSGQADASFYQKGSGIAKLEGAENISDLMQQLEDYLRQTGSQLSSLRGQKASAIEQLFNQMQSDQSSQAIQFENNRWQRLLSIAQLQRALQNDAAANMRRMAQGGEMPSRGLEGALAIINQSVGNDPTTTSALMNLLQTQQFREGRFESGNKEIVKMTPENAASMAREYAAAQKMTPQQTDALIKAVFAYYGKLR